MATGGLKPYVWSLASGSLPPGLLLYATYGAIYGRATTVGTWTFTVKVRDSQAKAANDTQVATVKVTQ